MNNHLDNYLRADSAKLIRCVGGIYNLICDGKLEVIDPYFAHRIMNHPRTRKTARNVWERRKPKHRQISFRCY